MSCVHTGIKTPALHATCHLQMPVTETGFVSLAWNFVQRAGHLRRQWINMHRSVLHLTARRHSICRDREEGQRQPITVTLRFAPLVRRSALFLRVMMAKLSLPFLSLFHPPVDIWAQAHLKMLSPLNLMSAVTTLYFSRVIWARGGSNSKHIDD